MKTKNQVAKPIPKCTLSGNVLWSIHYDHEASNSHVGPFSINCKKPIFINNCAMVSSVANNPQSVMVSLLRVVSNALGLSKHLGHGNNQTTIDHIIKNLSRTFAVKDMGYLSYFLVKTPITTTTNLALGDSPLFEDPVRYRQIVGSLQYATLSRPDIAYAVNKVCQFLHSPTEKHWSAVKRILRYLKGTADFGLLVRQESGSILHAYTDSHSPYLNAFSDADWAGCPDDRRSTGGYAIYLGSNLVSWSARKQKTVSRSSTESEYKALADTVAEITWLEALLRELRVPMATIPVLWCDNLGATYLTANPMFHARTKHIEVDFHFVREKVAEKKLSVRHISTKDQIADVFTKPLSSQQFESIWAYLDGYINIAMEQTEEYVNGQLKNKYGDAFIHGNSLHYISTSKSTLAEGA
ncbi:uncharacterized mitochondrial protein-like protein [Tanacetum coccineum]